MNDTAMTDTERVAKRVNTLTGEWLRLHEAIGEANEALQARPEYQNLHRLQGEWAQAWDALKREERILARLKVKAKRERGNDDTYTAAGVP